MDKETRGTLKVEDRAYYGSLDLETLLLFQDVKKNLIQHYQDMKEKEEKSLLLIESLLNEMTSDDRERIEKMDEFSLYDQLRELERNVEEQGYYHAEEKILLQIYKDVIAKRFEEKYKTKGSV